MHTKLTVVILNLLGLTAVIVTNALANILPINGLNTGQISAMYPNLFVPAGFTFSIWGIIYLLLIAQNIAQFYFVRKAANAVINSSIKQAAIPIFITHLLNISWILAWHYRYIFLSLFIMLALLLTLIYVFVKQQQTKRAISHSSYLLLNIPFVVYLSWICVATIANTTAVLIAIQWNGWGWAPENWTYSLLIIAMLISGTITFIYKEPLFMAVTLWALLGIAYQQFNNNNGISSVAGKLIAIGLFLFALTISRIRRTAGKTDS